MGTKNISITKKSDEPEETKPICNKKTTPGVYTNLTEGVQRNINKRS